MSTDLKATIQTILRPSEVVKVALEVTLAPAPPSRTDQAPAATTDAVYNSKNPLPRGALAVVSHRDETTTREQGCVFIFKRKNQARGVATDQFVIEHVLPIVGNFALSMAQPRRGTIDLSAGSALLQRSAELSLTIKPGHKLSIEPISILSNDTSGLRDTIAQCKQLKEIQDGNIKLYDAFSWIAPYVQDNTHSPLLSTIPLDLRETTKPLHTLLSPASAGQPGDEAGDALLIRERWMYKRVTQEIQTTAFEQASLKIRVCSFNVNGKMPSQDLSGWVRGRPANTADGDVHLPPLPGVSPLSLGDVGKSPDPMDAFDAAKVQREPSTASTQTLMPTSSTLSASTTTTSAFSIASADTLVPESESGTLRRREEELGAANDADVLVLAFQELDLSAEALLYSTKTFREDAWYMAALAGLGEKAELYEKLVSKQLVGMLLVVITKRRLKACFGDVKTTSAGAGIMGMMGNKGATAVRLVYTPITTSHATRPKPTVLTFVNSHLAAFDEMYDKRNTDFHDLSKRLTFDSGIPIAGAEDATKGYAPPTVQLSIFDTDVLFWMGDLNYRINLPDPDIRFLISSNLGLEDLQTLSEFDQLVLARRGKKAFEGFHEHPVTHLPTYRFSTGQQTDSKGYDVKRKPAWTDRIMHMAASPVDVRQLSYGSHPQITMSDHRPISAEFETKIPIIDMKKYEGFVHHLWKEVSRMEDNEDNSARLRVSEAAIDFGILSYKRPVTRWVDLENVGKIPCVYRLVPASPAADPIPDWLQIEDMAGLLLPGEKRRLSLKAGVDSRAASRLNTDLSGLEWTLILHVALGKDHFVSLSGRYERTCFSTSIRFLVRLPGPIRALKDVSELLPTDHALTLPREITRLVGWLTNITTDGVPTALFLTPGEQHLVERIRECLDTGTDFDPNAEDGTRVTLALGECMLQFLAALPEPVVPVSMHERYAQAISREEAFELLQEAPKESVNAWILVTALLHSVVQTSASPTYADRLVAKFANILLPDQPVASPVSVMGRRNFLRYFVTDME